MKTSVAGLAAAMLLGHASASAHHNHLHFHEHAARGDLVCSATVSKTYGTWEYHHPTSAAAYTSVVTVVPVQSESTTCTVCQTSVYTIIGSYGAVPCSSAPEETTSTVYSTTKVTVPVYTTKTTPPAPVYSSASSSAYVPPAPVYSAPVSSSQYAAPQQTHAYSAPAGGSGSAPIAPNGDLWSMAYTPYADNGACKSSSDIDNDIATIASKGFSTIRVYGTDCGTFSTIAPAAAAHGLKMILGVFIDGSGIGNAAGQVSQILAYGQWSNVEMIVVGNEAIFSGYASASELAGFISSSKAQFKAAGFTGPVTTTEPPGTFEQYSSTLCPAIDVIGSNIHPFFDPNTNAFNAGSYVSGTIATLSGLCGGSKAVYNLETGWPSQGGADGLAIAGFAEQLAAIEGIKLAAGSKSSFFSYQNDMWKTPGALGVEQFWGCVGLF